MNGKRPPREQRHGPLEVFGGAPPARSALTLRLVLASFGLIVCGGAAALGAIVGVPDVFVIVLCVIGAISLIDLGVIVRRKRRGEPG